MTDSDWLSNSDPQLMLAFLRHSSAGVSDRKFRLFACACCRRIWNHFPDQRNRDLVAAVEDNPGGTFDDPDLYNASVASSACEGECRENSAYWVAKYLGRGFYKMPASLSASIVAAKALFLTERELGRSFEGGLVMDQYLQQSIFRPSGLPSPLPPHVATEAQAQANLLRDVFGMPSRADSFESSWRTETVVLLAQQMDEAREFSAMPILADALQDAGCNDEQVLEHCRGKTPHTRGCWVVDRVLGRA